MSILRVLALVVTFSFASLDAAPESAEAHVTAQPTGEMSLERAIALALEKNYTLKISRATRANANEALEVAKAEFDPALSLSATRRYVNGQLSGSTSSTSSLDTRVGVVQRVGTGGVVSVGGALDRTRQRPVVSAFDPFFDSDVSLSVSQPLLANAGSGVARAGVERARLGVNRAIADLTSSVLATVRNVEIAFYNAAFARELRTVRAFSLEVSEKLLEEARTRRQTGVATDIDVLQAEVLVANARRALLTADQQVKNTEDTLVGLITPLEFGTLPETLTLPPTPTEPIDFQAALARARAQSPEVTSATLVAQQFRIDERVARRNRLPELDLQGAVGYSARDRSAGGAIDSVWGSDLYDWQIGATLRIPWGQRAEKARLRTAINNVQSAELRALDIDQDLAVDVRAAVRAIDTAREAVKITGLATQLSERQFELEKARYDAGVSTFRRVQESREDLDAARINELQAKIDLRNALSGLARLDGSSLTQYRITID